MKLRLGRDLHDAGRARLRDRARQFPRHQSGWPVFFAVMSSFSRETYFTKFVSDEIATTRSRRTSRRRPVPMPASPLRRARCNRHEPGLSPSYRVLSYGSDMEVWAFLARLSHCWRARSEVFAVEPLQRAAWTRWPSVVMSQAAAKHCFRCAKRNIHVSLFFMRPGQLGLQTCHLPSRPRKMSPPLVSVAPLVPQFHRYSIGFPHVWRAIFAILRTPTRLVTTPHSLL